MSSSVTVKILCSEAELQSKLACTTDKLVVLEFVKPGSQICKYLEAERNQIAKEMKCKAEFYELDVDKFKKYAEVFKLEALPAFVVMQQFVKKRRVVGTDDLKKAINDVYYAYFHSNNSSPNNDSEQIQAEANNSAYNAEPVCENGSEPDQPAPRFQSRSYVDSEPELPATKTCSIL